MLLKKTKEEEEEVKIEWRVDKDIRQMIKKYYENRNPALKMKGFLCSFVIL